MLPSQKAGLYLCVCVIYAAPWVQDKGVVAHARRERERGVWGGRYCLAHGVLSPAIRWHTHIHTHWVVCGRSQGLGGLLLIVVSQQAIRKHVEMGSRTVYLPHSTTLNTLSYLFLQKGSFC